MGKSSIVLKLFSEQFPKSYLPTIGFDFYNEYIAKHHVMVNCIDFGGTQISEFTFEPVLKSTDITLLICDKFDDSIIAMFDQFKQKIFEQNEFPVKFLVIRNKIDEIIFDKSEKEEVLNYCKKNNFSFVPLSAKYETNIDKLWEMMIKMLPNTDIFITEEEKSLNFEFF